MVTAKLQATPTTIPDVLIIESRVFEDNRGWFTESFNTNDFAKAANLCSNVAAKETQEHFGR